MLKWFQRARVPQSLTLRFGESIVHKIDKVVSDCASVELHLSDGVVMRINTNYGNRVHVSFGGCQVPVKAGCYGVPKSYHDLSNCFDLMYKLYGEDDD